MTRKIIVCCWVVFSIGYWAWTAYDFSLQRDTLAIKNKLLRREIAARQWEIDMAHSRNAELDMMRWEHRQTELQYPEWPLILETVYAMSIKYNVRGDLALAVIHRESFFDPLAMSNKGAYGLMQIRLSVWGDELGLTVDNITDIKTNIEAGFRILKIYLDDCGGDEVRALNKYWSGSIVGPHGGYVDRIFNSKFMLTK